MVSLLPLLACSGEPELTGPPDVVVVVVSGLRADTTEVPAESALYRGLGHPPALRFSAAYAQSCSLYTSMGSLLTGRYPSAIPLCNILNTNAPQPKSAEQPWCTTIPESTWTIPKVLSVYGYRTGITIADSDHTRRTNWRSLREQVSDWWNADTASPRLYFVQTLDLHMIQYDTLAGFDPQDPNLERRSETSQKDVLRASYVEHAEMIGEELARLLAVLPASDDRPRQIWLTSTNGISLQEESGVSSDHLKAATNNIIIDRTIHVPLALLEASTTPKVDTDRVVELTDLLPTLVAGAGAVLPAGLHGHDLLSAQDDASPWAYAEFGDMLAIRESRLLLTFRFFLHNKSSMDPRLTEGLLKSSEGSHFYALHDVQTDPMQERNRLKEDLEQAAALRQRMITVRTELGTPPPESMTAEQLESIQLGPAQGYW